MTPWRNGSASDSRSEGCVFKSRRGQFFNTLLRFVPAGHPKRNSAILQHCSCIHDRIGCVFHVCRHRDRHANHSNLTAPSEVVKSYRNKFFDNPYKRLKTLVEKIKITMNAMILAHYGWYFDCDPLFVECRQVLPHELVLHNSRIPSTVLFT